MIEVFMISSSESLDVAYRIKNQIETEASCKGIDIKIVLWFDWFRDAKNANEYNWDIIERACKEFKMVISLLRADDTVKVRGGEHKTTRDNVLVETGAFINELGKENVFLLADEDSGYEGPSDFLGINVSKFDYKYGSENKTVISNIIDRCSRKLSTMLEEAGSPIIKGDLSPIDNFVKSRGGRLA